MKQRPQLSDEEIRSYMDFDRVLANRKLIENKPKFHFLKWLVPAIAVVGIGSWLVFGPVEKDNQQDNVVVEDHSASTPSQSDTPDPLKEEATATPLKKETSPPVETSPKVSAPVRKNDDAKSSDNSLVEDNYIQAEPVDGYSSLYAYFNSNLVYPSGAIQDSVQGVETVSFVINTEGKPEKITIKQSLGEPFEKEARRLIENMPLWKPATLNGKPVPSQMSIPLTFQIQKVKR